MSVYKNVETYAKKLPNTIMEFCDRPRCYDRHDYPLIWNVKMLCGPTFETVWRRMCKDHYLCEADALVQIPSKRILEVAWEDSKEQHYEWSMESMCETFTRDDTMKSVSPKIGKRWGLDLSREPATWDVKYEFVGRSGGWLALTDFEGYHLTNRDCWAMEDGVRATEHGIPGCVAQKLSAMIEEVSWMVGKRNDELIYLLADHMRHNMAPEVVPE